MQYLFDFKGDRLQLEAGDKFVYDPRDGEVMLLKENGELIYREGSIPTNFWIGNDAPARVIHSFAAITADLAGLELGERNDREDFVTYKFIKRSPIKKRRT